MDETTKMGKKEFWLRLSVWLILAAGVPVCFLCFKYGMFSSNAETQLTGWGVLAIIIVSIVMVVLVGDVAKGLPDGSMMKQVVNGALWLIPLLLLVLLVHSIKESVAQFEEFLIVLLVCEAAAVPVNPLPKWAAQNNLDFQKKTFSDMSREAIDYFFKKKEE